MPEDPKVAEALVRVEKALGCALATIRERKGMTLDDVVRNTDTFFDRWNVERLERAEENRMFLCIPSLVRLIVEGLHADLHEVGQLVGDLLES